MTEQDELIFFKSFDKIFDRYEIARNAMLLPKNDNDLSKVHLAPLNELRNALFHIFKSIDEDSNIEYEHKAALVHYTRAQYDAFEIYIDEKIHYINNCLNQYNSEIIFQIFKKFYDIILPDVNDMKYSLSKERTERRKDTEKASELIFGKYIKVLDYIAEIEKQKSIIETEIKKRKRKGIKKLLFGAGFAIIVGSILGAIGSFFHVLISIQ